MPTTLSPPALTPESDLPIVLRKGMCSTRNPPPYYIALSYHQLSLPFYTCLSSLSSVTIPKIVCDTLAHPDWRQAMTDELMLFITVELGNWSHCHLGNLLLVAGGCLLSKLDLMVLLIASKLVLWPKVIVKFLGWIMEIPFPRDKDGFCSFIYRHGYSSTMASLSTRC